MNSQDSIDKFGVLVLTALIAWGWMVLQMNIWK